MVAAPGQSCSCLPGTSGRRDHGSCACHGASRRRRRRRQRTAHLALLTGGQPSVPAILSPRPPYSVFSRSDDVAVRLPNCATTTTGVGLLTVNSQVISTEAREYDDCRLFTKTRLHGRSQGSDACRASSGRTDRRADQATRCRSPPRMPAEVVSAQYVGWPDAARNIADPVVIVGDTEMFTEFADFRRPADASRGHASRGLSTSGSARPRFWSPSPPASGTAAKASPSCRPSREATFSPAFTTRYCRGQSRAMPQNGPSGHCCLESATGCRRDQQLRRQADMRSRRHLPVPRCCTDSRNASQPSLNAVAAESAAARRSMSP